MSENIRRDVRVRVRPTRRGFVTRIAAYGVVLKRKGTVVRVLLDDGQAHWFKTVRCEALA